MDKELRDRLIASAVTLLAVIAALLLLMFSGLHYDSRLADVTNPSLDDEDEEVFLDPELLVPVHESVGEPEATAKDTPAPEVKGEPAPAPVEQPHTVTTGESQVPQPEPKLVTSNKESTVQNAESNKKKEEEKVATSMAGKFSGKSGSVAGKFDSPGGSTTSETGSGVTGRMSGRQFLGCPLPDVTLTHKTTVTVSITVDAEGHVTSATASGAATRAIRKKCEEAAMQARWSAKKGAASTRGTITFSIIPK